MNYIDYLEEAINGIDIAIRNLMSAELKTQNKFQLWCLSEEKRALEVRRDNLQGMIDVAPRE